MGTLHGKPERSERPDWAQRMLVIPTLVAVDTRLWIAPERKTWSLTTGAWDGLTQELLALKVGPEMRGTDLGVMVREIERSAKRTAEEMLNRDPF